MLVHKGTQELLTARLTLRRYRLTDAEAMFQNYAADERVTRFLPWAPYQSAKDVRAFLMATIQKYESPRTYHWAIGQKSEVMGSISVTALDEKNASCEVGYCLAYQGWNKGIATEALRAVLQFLFTEVHMHRVTAKHDADNPASGRVMEKCGMRPEGRLQGALLKPDASFADTLIYGIVDEEFSPSV